MDALDRARAALAADRAWKARDILEGLLVSRCDVEVLDLLGEVHHAMRDYPAAGAVWFASGRDDEVARGAVEAWRERHGNDHARWQTLPRPIRTQYDTPDLAALRAAAEQHFAAAQAKRREQPPAQRPTTVRERVGEAIAICCLLGVLALLLIGFVTVAGWVWP